MDEQIKNIFFVFLAVIIVVGLVFISTNNNNPAKIVISPEEYDAGTVSIADGNLVEKTFEVKNDGQGDLKINSIWTSCMCTNAHLRIGDKTSPEFGMHTQSTLWSAKIPPGETGYLDVTFDPAFHGPDGTGSMVRVVYLTTNDASNKQAQVKMLINVVK